MSRTMRFGTRAPSTALRIERYVTRRHILASYEAAIAAEDAYRAMKFDPVFGKRATPPAAPASFEEAGLDAAMRRQLPRR